MQYRDFGNLGYKISALGYGAMRLPEDEEGNVRRDEAVAVIRAAVDAGINYVDTAPLYNRNQSEEAVGEALADGYRERVWLSTKNQRVNDDAGDWRRRLDESLRKLKTDYVDVYHVWGISWKEFTEHLAIKDGPLAAARKAQDEGLLRHLFFSFHAPPEDLFKIIDTGEFVGCTVQYNLIDRKNEAGIAHAAAKGLAVVIMGPVGGGRLAGPSSVIEDSGFSAASTPELAFRFVLANANVSCAISGMSSREQLRENVATASRADRLDEAELAQINESFDEYRKLAELYCTSCDYCAPCPEKVAISRVLALYNLARVYGLEEAAKKLYAEIGRTGFFARMNNAAACTSCGECAEKCPQKLDIPEELAAAHAALADDD
ncbi:MAG TPA: aldo/keto reductase [bacterium]|nr:aldo/keto reductase [bacterium]